MISSRAAAGVVLWILASTSPAVSAPCVQGTISGVPQLTGPYAGLYEYTVDLAWSTPRGLSHVTLDCGFESCPAAACAVTWVFGEPAGSAPGEDGCDLEFEGEFNCEGDDSIDMETPVLKWDAGDGEGCEAGREGTATLRFYTDVPPSGGLTPVVLVKNGTEVCSGTLVGDCPLVCPTPVERLHWGVLKSRYP